MLRASPYIPGILALCLALCGGSARATPWVEVDSVHHPPAVLPEIGFPGDGVGMMVLPFAEGVMVTIPDDTSFGGEAQGALQYFRRVGGRWVPGQRLVPPEHPRKVSSPYLVAVTGSMAMAGPVVCDTPAGPRSCIDVWRYANGEFERVQRLLAPTPDEIGFGSHMSADGDHLLVGSAFSEPGVQLTRKRAFVFTLVDGLFDAGVELRPPANIRNDRAYGGSAGVVAGNTIALAIAVPAQAANVFERGVIAIQTKENGVWAERQRLLNPRGETPEFAKNAALTGDDLLVSEMDDPGCVRPDRILMGAIHVFRRVAGRFQWRAATCVPSAFRHDLRIRGRLIDGLIAADYSVWEAFGAPVTRPTEVFRLDGDALVSVQRFSPPPQAPDALPAVNGIVMLPGALVDDSLLPHVPGAPGILFGHGGYDPDVLRNYASLQVGVWDGAAFNFEPDPLRMPADPTPDSFGEEVSLEGDTMVVSSMYERVAGVPYAGAVRVLRRGPAGWTVDQVLTSAMPLEGGKFGVNMELSGDHLAIAEFNRPGDPSRLTLYERGAGGFEPIQTLEYSESTFEGYNGFGLSGDTLVVNEVWSEGVARSLREYRFADGRWTLLAHVAPPPGLSEPDDFGANIEVSGDILLVGMLREPVAGFLSAGAVAVYERVAGEWGLTQVLESPDPDDWAHFGITMAIGPDRLYVRAEWDFSPPNVERPWGPAEVFVRQDGRFTHTESLLGEPAMRRHGYAQRIAAGGDHVAITHWRTGFVDVYRFVDGRHVFEQTLTRQDSLLTTTGVDWDGDTLAVADPMWCPPTVEGSVGEGRVVLHRPEGAAGLPDAGVPDAAPPAADVLVPAADVFLPSPDAAPLVADVSVPLPDAAPLVADVRLPLADAAPAPDVWSGLPDVAPLALDFALAPPDVSAPLPVDGAPKPVGDAPVADLALDGALPVADSAPLAPDAPPAVPVADAAGEGVAEAGVFPDAREGVSPGPAGGTRRMAQGQTCDCRAAEGGPPGFGALLGLFALGLRASWRSSRSRRSRLQSRRCARSDWAGPSR